MFANSPPEPDLVACLPQARSIDHVRLAFMDVLGLGQVADDDDFFALGGDSILAVALFLHIECSTGRRLPITSLYDAASVAELAALIDGDRRAVRTSHIVTLRAGRAEAGPPLFMVHGLGGSVMILRDCAARIEGSFAIYGLELPGLDGVSDPLESVQDLARLYLEDIDRTVGAGPFALAGYSFGGLIAFEMACRLAASGRPVTRLILLDSFPHPSLWAADSRVTATLHAARLLASPAIWLKLFAYKRRQLRGKSAGAALLHLARAVVRAASLPFDALRTQWVHDFAQDRVATAPEIAPGIAGVLLETAHVAAARRAYAGYQPGRFDGRVHFVKAEAETSISFDPQHLWGRQVRRLDVHRLPLDHQALVRAGAAQLAAKLSSILAEPGNAA